jgi:hypothetical protein
MVESGDQQSILTSVANVLIWAGLYQMILKIRSKLISSIIYAFLLVFLVIMILTFALEKGLPYIVIIIMVSIKSLTDFYIEYYAVQELRQQEQKYKMWLSLLLALFFA